MILSSCYAKVEEETLARKISLAEKAADRCKNKESWDLVNEVSGRKKNFCGLIEGGGSEGRLKAWKDHFTKLLGQPPQVPDDQIIIDPVHPPLNISTDDFDKIELELAKDKTTEGKACGVDGITPEVMKRVDIDDIILEFCNKTLHNGDIPDQWRHLNIVPVPKKGNLTKTDNYRGIALSSVVSKTLNRMILNRLKPHLEPLLRINQNGFRDGRSTTSHILALRRILEGARSKKLTSVMLFIDFKKAFDSLHRGLLMKILRAYGIPHEIVCLIERLYDNTIAQVITEDGLTEAFLILAGVMQGDTLAPYLFIIAIDYILNKAMEGKYYGFTLQQRRSRRYPAVKISDADFADDLALITDTIAEAQRFLLSLEEAANAIGLHLNKDKTKYLAVNCEPDTIKAKSGDDLKEVKDFVYLGS